MNNSIPCLLDTNAIVKYYHDIEKGSEIIKYLFDVSPSAQINITDLHIWEVVSIFHLVCKREELDDMGRDKAIDTFLKDIREKNIFPYEFNKEHSEKFFSNLYITYKVDPPKKKRRIFIPFKNGYSTKLKDVADVNDVAMLTIMQEIQTLIGESYLFTSDGHVKKIATAMSLSVLDPEKMDFKDIPLSLDKRNISRKPIKVKAICQEAKTNMPLGSRKTIDISSEGACVAMNKKIDLGTSLKIRFSKGSYNCEVTGQIVWSNFKKTGIKFQNSNSIDIAPFVN